MCGRLREQTQYGTVLKSSRMSLLAANYVKTCQMCGSLYQLPVYQTPFVVAAKLFTELCGTSHGTSGPYWGSLKESQNPRPLVLSEPSVPFSFWEWCCALLRMPKGTGRLIYRVQPHQTCFGRSWRLARLKERWTVTPVQPIPWRLVIKCRS